MLSSKRETSTLIWYLCYVSSNDLAGLKLVNKNCADSLSMQKLFNNSAHISTSNMSGWTCWIMFRQCPVIRCYFVGIEISFSGIFKGTPWWAHASPAHINCLCYCLVCPVTGIKGSIYSNKTVSSSIVPTQLIQSCYATRYYTNHTGIYRYITHSKCLWCWINTHYLVYTLITCPMIIIDVCNIPMHGYQW